MKSIRGTAIAVLIGALAVLGVAACGSSSNNGGGGGGNASAPKGPPLKAGENPVGQQLYGKKKGGTLTVYSSEDYENLDPGGAYFENDYTVLYNTGRPLFTYPPNSASTLAPDLATEVPTTANGGISKDGKTVTVHIQPNVKFSPPVNRAVTSQDVAYAIERGANPNVGNGYWSIYFKDLVGFKSAKGGPFPGITTPNSTTIVFHLTQPSAQTLIGALSMPLSEPVPASMAGPADKHAPTQYGKVMEAFTGPYMIQEDTKTGKFAGIGYQTGKQLTLVRNPNWDPSTYSSQLYKPPAYLNQIKVNIGGDATVIGQQVLKGSDAVQEDTPAQSIVQTAYNQYPSQITFTEGSGDHYGGLDTQHGPFKNVWIRRAVWAAIDREAIVKARGGPLVASPMTHFIYPGNDPAYTDAGGAAGPDFPWNKNVNGDMAEAHALMKKAGYPSGKYTGGGTVQEVAGNNGNAPTIAQLIQNTLTQLGFHVHLSLVDQSAMYGKYCGVPKANIDICPSSGWIRDFNNPLSVLYVPFSGEAITPVNNSNWSQLNDPAINKAMNDAALITDPTQSAQAWANIDKQLVNIAAALPEEWDSQANIRSKDVEGVNDLWDTGSWDYSFTSLQNP